MKIRINKKEIINRKIFKSSFFLRALFSLLIVLSGFNSIRAQESENEFANSEFISAEGETKSQITNNLEAKILLADEAEHKESEKHISKEIEKYKPLFSNSVEFEKIRKERLIKIETKFLFKEGLNQTESNSETDTFKATEEKIHNLNYIPEELTKEKFHWKPALIQSGVFLGIQHGFRLIQKKTQRELDGKFFNDWAESVTNLRGWGDGDNPLINYIAHPLQGGVTGRIFINNSDNAKKQEFSKSADYWKSRFKTFVWSAVWSTQFEIGPISEANIGNVGLFEKNGKSSMAWVDMVITPVVGTGLVIGEDAIDKYILKNWFERKNGYKITTKIKILRTFLTPTTSFSNILRWKYPWKRDFR